MEHFFENIQGWLDEGTKQLYREAVEQAPVDRPSVFVELGSWKGKSAAFAAVEIFNSGKSIMLYCIDHWDPAGDASVPYFAKDPDTPKALDIFRDNLSMFSFVMPIKAKSWEWVDVILDPVDFIYIDASHEYEDVLRDLEAWIPRMAPNGVISGDDYPWPGVWRAINEVFGASYIECVGGNCWRVPTISKWARMNVKHTG